MNLPTNILEKDISTLFGFDEMSDDERVELLENVGKSIIESAVLRFVVDASEDKIEEFNAFIDTNKDDGELIEKLVKTFPLFETFLVEEITAFKGEAEKVLTA